MGAWCLDIYSQMSIQGVSTASIDDCAYHRCLVLPAVMQGIFATGKSNIIIINAVASCLMSSLLPFYWCVCCLWTYLLLSIWYYFPLGSAQNDDARHSIFAIGKSNSIINAVACLICPLLLLPECSFQYLLL